MEVKLRLTRFNGNALIITKPDNNRRDIIMPQMHATQTACSCSGILMAFSLIHHLISWPHDGAFRIIISSSVFPSAVAFSSCVSSTCTTASADGGTAAPVLMRMQSPPVSSLLNCTTFITDMQELRNQ